VIPVLRGLPFAASLLLAACSGVQVYENGKLIEPPACPGDAQSMTRVELLFGRSRPGGPPVTDDEWTAFIDAEVATRFPEGFTVFDGSGGSGGRVGRT